MISVQVRRANGNVLRKVVADPDFNPVLLGIDAFQFPHLGGIDPYGDTVFNGLQVRRLLDELRQYKATCTAPASFIAELEDLCRMTASGTHMFLWFIGD